MIGGVADDGLEILRQYLWGSPSAFFYRPIAMQPPVITIHPSNQTFI
jgi:hypothetical protein